MKDKKEKRSVASHILIAVLASILCSVVNAWYVSKQGYSVGDTLSPASLRISAIMEAAVGLILTITGASAVKINKLIGRIMLFFGIGCLLIGIVIFILSGSLSIVIG